MSSIFVYINKRGDQVFSIIIENAMKAMRHWIPDHSCTWINHSIGIGCHLLFTTHVSKIEKLPYWDDESGCCITADARIDYREELAEKLDLEQEFAKNLPDSQFILMSYIKWGERCVDHLYGDFAFVIWDEHREKLFCARDHFGCRPLYYIDHADFFAMSSDPRGFKALPNFSLKLDDQYILDAVCSIFPNKKASAYTEINRLEPAHCLTFSSGHPLQKARYWDLQNHEEFTSLTESEAIQGLRERFLNSVRQRSYSINPVGIELSGGLDSSSIASSLVKVLDNGLPIYAFSHALSTNQVIRPPSYNNELEFSKRVAELYDILNHCIVTEEGQAGSGAAILNALHNTQKPSVQVFAMMSDLLYEMVNQSGINVLISGFGGDEGVTYYGSGFFEELMKKKEFKRLREALRKKIERNGGHYNRQLIKHYIQFIAPWLILLLRKDWRRSRFSVFAIDRTLRKKFHMKKRYFKRVFFPRDPDLRRRQYQRILHPHVSDRLENSYFAAQSKRIEYRYPFFDVKLIEFYYSLNSEFKYKNGLGRYVFRMAMEGILFDEIRFRTDKTGPTIPNVMYRLVKDEIKFREIIEEGRINNTFHYVNYDKLHWMLDHFKDGSKRRKINFGPREFISPISVLILQKWQREGILDIGIKC